MLCHPDVCIVNAEQILDFLSYFLLIVGMYLKVTRKL